MNWKHISLTLHPIPNKGTQRKLTVAMMGPNSMMDDKYQELRSTGLHIPSTGEQDHQSNIRPGVPMGGPSASEFEAKVCFSTGVDYVDDHLLPKNVKMMVAYGISTLQSASICP